MTMDLKTPLYDCHVALEGRMVPFAGGVGDSLQNVGSSLGLLDIHTNTFTHMCKCVKIMPQAGRQVLDGRCGCGGLIPRWKSGRLFRCRAGAGCAAREWRRE